MLEKKPFERLPKAVVPLHYDLFLKPDLKSLVFDGQQTVKLDIKEPVNQIILNSLELVIHKCELTSSDGKKSVPEVKLVSEDETAILLFGSSLPVGPASLFISFSGELNNKMKGFYRSNIAQSGEPKYAAVTQFESTNARRCFPCWDEPAIKAEFEVTLQVPTDKVAISNMPVINETKNNNGTKTLKFACSPIMSTYLVAFVVGDFEYVEDKTEDGVIVRVYTPVGLKENGKFALYVTTKVIPFYNEYFGVKYDLPKIDLVAIADFAMGAMENWGLLTYRQAALLVDNNNTSASRKQYIGLVVGHEVAHQWFGNLVTMEWWTHLWLKEGYASFIEYLCMDHLFPEYNMWTQFVSDVHIHALELDCLKNSHPIEVPVGHSSEIEEIFDAISYDKGASIIRMLHNYIGDKDFRKGMNIYLTRHQYGNTFTEDLWQALQEASSKPVREIMSTWTSQKGFPFIKITGNKQEGSNRQITVTQEVFSTDANEKNEDRLWLVPLSFSVKGQNKIFDFVLEGRSQTFTLENVNSGDWVKLNPGTYGFYRTSYPEDMLSLLTSAIRDKSLPPLDRVGIIDDLLAFAQAGHCPTTTVLDMISAVQDEDNYTVWRSIVNCLNKLDVLASNTDNYEQFKKLGVRVLSTIGSKVGWVTNDDDGHTDRLLRSLVLTNLGMYGNPSTVEEARRLFSDLCNGTATIPPDLRSSVYTAVLANGDKSTFNAMMNFYREQSLQEEKDRIYRSLGSIRDKELLRNVLDFSLQDEIRTQDKVIVITSVAKTKVGRELAWQFLKEKWSELYGIYDGGYLLGRLIKGILVDFTSKEVAIEAEEFFKAKGVSVPERAVQQSIESIRINAKWLQRDRKLLVEYLTKQSGL